MARIIDADGHIVEPRKLWEEYVEPNSAIASCGFSATPMESTSSG